MTRCTLSKARHLLCLSLIPLPSSVNTEVWITTSPIIHGHPTPISTTDHTSSTLLPRFSTTSCPSTDKEGNVLTSVSGNLGTVVLCNYAGGGVCAYFGFSTANVGRLDNDASKSTACPDFSPDAPNPPPQSSATLTEAGKPTPSSRPISESPSLSLTSTPSTSNPTISGSVIGSSGSKSLPHRNGVRIAAIAVSVVSVGIFLAVVLLLLWVRRRRQRIEQRTLPEKFVDEQEHMQRDAMRDNIKDVGRVNVLVMGEKAGDAGPGNLHQTDPICHEPENGELADGEPEEGSPPEETLTLRVRRMEAQLEALLSTGLPEVSPPPSYAG